MPADAPANRLVSIPAPRSGPLADGPPLAAVVSLTAVVLPAAVVSLPAVVLFAVLVLFAVFVSLPAVVPEDMWLPVGVVPAVGWLSAVAGSVAVWLSGVAGPVAVLLLGVVGLLVVGLPGVAELAVVRLSGVAGPVAVLLLGVVGLLVVRLAGVAGLVVVGPTLVGLVVVGLTLVGPAAGDLASLVVCGVGWLLAVLALGSLRPPEPETGGGGGFGVAGPADDVAPPLCAVPRSGVEDGGGAGFGVPGFRGEVALPAGVAAGGRGGFGVPALLVGDGFPGFRAGALPEAAGLDVAVAEEPMGELEIGFAVVPGAAGLACDDAELVDAELVVTVLRELGPGVTVLCPALLVCAAPLGGSPARAAPLGEPVDRAVPDCAALGCGGPGCGLLGGVGPEGGPLFCVGPGFAGVDGVLAVGVPGEGESEAGSFGAGGVAGGWPSAGARLDSGGPGFGRFRLGAGRRPSVRPRLGTLISVSRAGSRP